MKVALTNFVEGERFRRDFPSQTDRDSETTQTVILKEIEMSCRVELRRNHVV